MKEINYKNLIDNKLSKQTNEDNGTAYVAVDGQYEEQSGYGYTQDEWITLYEGIMPLSEDEDGKPLLWSNTTINFPENVSPDSVNKIRLIISGENNHDVTSGITYTSGSTICFGNEYFATHNTDNNGLPYGVVFQNNDIYMGASNTFISNGDHVTIMGCILSVKQIDSSLLPADVFVKGKGEYSIQAKNDTPNMQATGDYAVAEGRETRASGIGSHAEGNITTASGETSHAEGYYTTASGYNSHAEGANTISEGSTSHAEGNYTRAHGVSSHAEGYYTTASGYNSHAEGCYTNSIGMGSHSEGGGSSAVTLVLTGSGPTYNSTNTLEEYYMGQSISYNGINTYITGINKTNGTVTVQKTLGTLDSASIKIALHTVASGSGSHAEGYITSSSNSYTHAEGYYTSAKGSYSHAEGYACTSSGLYAHAEGEFSIAKSQTSHAEGSHTIASGYNQHASGKYNIEDLNNTYAEIIGIGTAKSSCKNGRTLDWSGNEQLAGSLTLGLGTNNEVTITAAQLKQLLSLLAE